MISNDSRILLKEALRRRARRKREPKVGLKQRILGGLSKLYTSPTFWTGAGGAMGAGTVLLGTKRKGKLVVSRIPSRKALAVMMGLWGAGSSAAEAILDRVMYGKAYRTRKKEKKLWKVEKKL